jgi:hypothetical protein
MKKLIILLVAFSAIVIAVLQFEQKHGEESSILLRNNIVFSGRISKIKISSNHNFGILFLQIGNITNFLKNQHQKNKKFPYLIIDRAAEVYTKIPNGILVGDSVSVVSNNEIIYYYNNKVRKKLRNIFT